MNHPPDLGPDGPAALARLTRQATYRGNVVAREVVSHPLEHLHATGQLTDAQYEAARRVRRALAGSWPQPRVTTAWHGYAAQSALDEATDGLTDEEAWERRAELNSLWRAAERVCGHGAWPWVRGVCEGYWPGSRFRYDLLRAGLSALVSEWRLTR